ncbi:MAG: MBL fold metallo-hydrolase, partial [Methanomassiliicoccaceae archaeon]|nr:MBL fold metallo-hydrolase [Methanomassiliicoccaceae archaeon]
MVDILFAGTGASVPSRERSLPCVAVRIKGNIILFDCGEGSQRQLMMSPFSFMKIRGIFVSHMHGDHFLGIPGLLQTMNMSGRKDKLTLAGPEGFSDAIASLLKMCGGGLNYEIDVKDAKDGDIFTFKGYTIEAFSVDHGIPALGFAFREDDRQGRFDREKAMSLGLQPGPDFSKLQEGKKVKGVDPKDVIGPERKGRVIVYSG